MADEKVDTAERIKQAAIDEFSEHGYAGARVDRIARRAKCNKGMLYHHYGGKEALWEVAIDAVSTETEAAELAKVVAQESFSETACAMYNHACVKKLETRLLLWEQLEPDIPHHEESRHRLCKELMRDNWTDDDEMRPMLGLAMAAIAIFPQVMPVFTKILTGSSPETPGFDERYLKAIRLLLSEKNLDAPDE